jgi:phosphate transport system substrate-binding protein
VCGGTFNFGILSALIVVSQVVGGVVPVYNIPMLQQTDYEVLVLDRTTLAYIFMGNITTWNDPRILALQNAAVKAKIENEDRLLELVVRDDNSGSTEVFTKSLNL